MILAGIDEAGLGPLLGPLCTCVTALRVPDEAAPNSPWEFLSACVTDTPSRKEARLVVTDSKVVYRRGNRAALARPLRAFMAQVPRLSIPLPDKLTLLEVLGATDCVDDLPLYPWYAEAEQDLPEDVCPHDFDNDTQELNKACAAAGIAVCDLRATVTNAGRLNQAFGRGLKKSTVTLAVVGEQIKNIVRDYPDEEILLVVDKQGGRTYYHPFLSELFPGAWIQPVREAADCSCYLWERAGGNLRVEFMPRADRSAFTVALASMLAKYLRELFMADLNNWFGERVTDLRPTAGYYTDGKRWLADTAVFRAARGISDDLLVRQR